VSVPSASGTTPAATAAADPPELPPVTRPGSQRAADRPGVAEYSVLLPMPNASRLVVAITTAPAARNRATAVASKGERCSRRTAAPAVVRTPATHRLSFTAIGTPASGPGSRPEPDRGVDRPGGLDGAGRRWSRRRWCAPARVRARQGGTPSSSAERAPERTSAAMAPGAAHPRHRTRRPGAGARACCAEFFVLRTHLARLYSRCAGRSTQPRSGRAPGTTQDQGRARSRGARSAAHASRSAARATPARSAS
jgi:hypothetical protein